ncbi:mitochondrial branched-chain alpha-ketoacid dehydrogenase kinase-domain-containing protein [Cladochytrium replicatum]|nr:mitochondrial branched-chain alpha-ketoacid dehydrogenase kinase-domain-containing protein [Cladochytrium replicatum]
MANSRVIMEKVKHFASFPQTPVSLKYMVDFGRNRNQATLLSGTQFMHQELPIRLAHRVVELENLPHGLSEMPSVDRVKRWYIQSFAELTEFPSPTEFGVPTAALDHRKGEAPVRMTDSPVRFYRPSNVSDSYPEVQAYNEKFVKLIEAIKRRHDPVVTTMAQGVMEVKEHWRMTHSPLYKDPHTAHHLPLPSAIQSFLDRFYMSRIGIRMLIGQHVALARPESSTPPDYVGIICTRTSVRKVAQEAVDNARYICADHYGLWGGPEVRLIFPGDDDVEFAYVPSHLHHMLFELLKNSLRAVVERFGDDKDEWPEIKMVVAAGKEDLTIKISDEGGGIPRRGMPLIWTYMYTTAERPAIEDDFNKSDFKAPLAGFGYGLPLSRLYARYFGGDLRLISMEGYGTDAYLHLSRLSDSEEPLP